MKITNSSLAEAAAVASKFTGRTQIFTTEAEITTENISKVLGQAYLAHLKNQNDIEYLYKYYKGDQPILARTKTVRDDICNKIVENRANQIVSFKAGYLVGEPIQYVSRNSEESVSKNISVLNEYMFSEGKAAKDKELVTWQEICGTAYRMVLPDAANEEDYAPFEIYTLDPRYTFVVYSNRIGHKPLMGVCFTVDNDATVHFSVYTETTYYELTGSASPVIQRVEDYLLGIIPIIEYPANIARLGAFEIVLPILDALNLSESNRLDGIEQFIQSLLVFYNCTLPDDGQGNTMTADVLRENGVVFIKSVGENKADIKEISEQLDQSQTQTLVDSLESTWLRIVGMPSQGDGNTSESSNNGAVIFKNGWQGAETRAKERELAFIPPEQETLRLVLRICNNLAGFSLKVSDITIKFTRRNYADILSKAQVLTTMLNNEKVAPIDAYTVCGLFPDPEDACRRGLAWYESNKVATNELNTDRRTEQVEEQPADQAED